MKSLLLVNPALQAISEIDQPPPPILLGASSLPLVTVLPRRDYRQTSGPLIETGELIDFEKLRVSPSPSESPRRALLKSCNCSLFLQHSVFNAMYCM